MLVAIALTVAAACQGEPPAAAPFHAVGFHSSWVLDEGRRYRYPGDSGAVYGGPHGAPRPVLVNEWYPATGTDPERAMVHGDYFAIESAGERIAPFAQALAEYAREIAREEVGAQTFEAALNTPARVFRDAEPATGPFPVVLYHSGAGSSFEDNAAFCARLASRGYVVLGSAFCRADGSDLGIDGGDGSGDDLELLTRHAASLPHADAGHLALAGHSAGAQAVLRHACKPSSRVDALVLLDTTVDYYGLDMPLHARLVDEVLAAADDLALPLFAAASSEASFQLCDRLDRCRRIYWTVPALGHNEYIAQGLQALTADDSEHATAVRAAHTRLVDDAVAFLDAELRGEGGALARAISAGRASTIGGPAPHVELAEVGVAAPAPYDPQSPNPPTPRQLPHLLRERGPALTGEVLVRFAGRGCPWEESNMVLGSLLWELVETEGRVGEARDLLARIETFRPRVTSLFTFLADFAELVGRRADARRAVAVHSALAPDDEALRSRLADLSDPASDR
ncbi:hypothetical protein [Engelhardtia mirabilis]|uniref:Alpha/beta hydrolase family protein n=1 Tax=Engelhardtia mirabilis TaxID=2528011 RepID=A0A518BRI9_9BACT|nr:Alpha/beta hydrolase family protein [Planctomycetes bacterium Pla133]QDV03899.1 Alpha/beta hydrolase family protein [Planctomycetes bacterium Pla86]